MPSPHATSTTLHLLDVFEEPIATNMPGGLITQRTSACTEETTWTVTAPSRCLGAALTRESAFE